MRFLGLVGFYRRFIKGFAEIAELLTRLTKNIAAFEWLPDQQRAFITLKEQLLAKPILLLPIHANQPAFRPFTLETYASDVAIAAVLMQDDSDGIAHPRLFASRQLSKSEKNYSVSDRE